MAEHRHRFHPVIVKLCTCGEEGEECEACGKACALEDMHSDAEACWFCPRCWAALEAEARAAGTGGEREGT